MPNDQKIIRVAISVPLYRLFDYSVPQGCALPVVGSRVKVSFGSRELIAVVMAVDVRSDVVEKLKPISASLDTEPIVSADLLKIVDWLSHYYLAPVGQVVDLVLPKKLRMGQAASPSAERQWQLSELGQCQQPETLKRAKIQRQIFEHLQQGKVLSRENGPQFGQSWRQAVKSLLNKGLLVECEVDKRLVAKPPSSNQQLKLSAEQQAIVAGIPWQQGFAVHLIHGVTGSGKTEVYLQLVEQVIQSGKQALLLVPEIGLTPQFIDRVAARLSARIAVMHSGLTDEQRHQAWWFAKTGGADIVLGTRAAVFTAFDNLGLIVVDEEHDASFKQQDGVRYHARDVAIMRAKQLEIPILLGSATPAFETYQNALKQKYTLWQMQQRATGEQLPDVEIIDLTAQQPRARTIEGFSQPLIHAIEQRLNAGEQSILYVNRRGFAPTLYCPECSWIAKCQRCDAHLTQHVGSANTNYLDVRCHHCGYQARHPKICPSCHRSELQPIGAGTQRVESSVKALFPTANVLRLDRDSVSKKGAFEEKLNAIRAAQVDIILGTQMLTKGHDFPNVTLVGVLNADQGLYSSDFRGPEKMFQQVLQVAGRAGRHRPGKVLIQTRFAEHPVFTQLISQDYSLFAQQSLLERQSFAYPPFSYLALLRAESVIVEQGLTFLHWCRQQCPQSTTVLISDPVAAPMEKRAGRFRAQLLFKSTSRQQLHQVLQCLIQQISQSRQRQRVRWSLDVDPVELL